MSFATVFADIRRRRRIPMRLFSTEGVSPSYIHDLERGYVLPSAEKLSSIANVIRGVAADQGADPEPELRELFRARDLSFYVDRLALEPPLARLLVELRTLDKASVEDIEAPLAKAIAYFATLDQSTRRLMARGFVKAMSVLEQLDATDRNNVGVTLAERVDEVIDPLRAGVSPEAAAATAPKAALSTPKPRPTRRSTAGRRSVAKH